MQSGVISPENIADVLRGISQRRRQGTLEISASDDSLVIKFVQGRVVEASSSHMSGVQETVAWLCRAGYPCRGPEEYTETTYSALLETLLTELPPKSSVSSDQLRNLVRHRVLDRLYSMEVGAGAFYTFKVQMVDHEKEFSPSISIGQVLLDLVELQVERDLFDSKFPPGTVVNLTGTPPSGLSEEESTVVRAIGAGGEIREVCNRAMLSTFHFRHAVLELSSAAIISIGGSDAGRGAVDAAGELDDFLNSSIDSAFGIVEDESTERMRTTNADTLGEMVESIDEGEYSGDRIQLNYVAASSTRLLQNVWVPSIIALGFLILAVVSPFMAWSGILALFADL